MPTDYTPPSGHPQGADEPKYILPPKTLYDDLLTVVYQLEAAHTNYTQRTLFSTPLNIRAVVMALISHFYTKDETSSELDYIIFFLDQLAKHKNCESWGDFFVRIKAFLSS